MVLPVGPLAFNLIVAEEDVSELWYNARAIHPVCPGGSSGVTFGIGYDAGQQTAQTIRQDWDAAIGISASTRLAACAGLKGAGAAAIIPRLRDIEIPWATALTVFGTSTLPRYAAQTEAALPNCADLPADAFGALVSIGYNRGNGGWTMDDDRHYEMCDIRDALDAKLFANIPSSILSMQRLWPEGSDLWNRRAHEAALFEKALTA